MNIKALLSQKLSSFNKFPLLVIIISFILLNFIFSKILYQPQEYLFSDGGDGVKNYYSCIYYVLNDTGALFTGMNYPYGENVVYTDNQPVISWVLKLYHLHINTLTPAAIIGILNSLMILSIGIGAFFLFKILRKNLLPNWYSLIAAMLIVFLSPQLQRLLGHYALSYTFIIPCLWYIAICILQAPKKIIYYILYFGVTLLFGFIHPYYLLLSAFFLLAYTFTHFFQNPSKIKSGLSHLIGSVLAVVLPVAIFQAWLQYSTPIHDRPATPYGFLIYRSSFESVFYPTESPFKEFWQTVFKTPEPIWEGHAYVGVLGTVTLGLTIILALRYLSKGNFKLIVRPILPSALRPGVWASTFILLFACGIPFIYNLEFLLEFLPPLKQFRSIGRFAWIFYYVYAVYTAFYFYKLFRYLKQRQLTGFAYSFIGVILFVWAIDNYIAINSKVKTIKERKHASNFSTIRSNYSNFLSETNKYASDFQAILPLPYFHNGSEVFSLESSGSLYEAMKASVNLQLPILGVMMSRTSLSQSLSSIQVVSSEFIDKKILADLPSKKPFLVIVTKEGLRPQEQALLAQAKKLAENEWVTLYELPVSALQSKKKEALEFFEKNRSSFFQVEDYYTSSPKPAFFAKNFISKTDSSKDYLFDSGSAQTDGQLNLFKGQMQTPADSTVFEASVWLNVNTKKGLGVLKYRQFNAEGQIIEEKEALARQTVDVYENWVRPTLTFTLYKPSNNIEIFFEGSEQRLDNFLIRPKNTDIYYLTDSNNLIYNNFYIGRLN